MFVQALFFSSNLLKRHKVRLSRAFARAQSGCSASPSLSSLPSERASGCYSRLMNTTATSFHPADYNIIHNILVSGCSCLIDS